MQFITLQIPLRCPDEKICSVDLIHKAHILQKVIDGQKLAIADEAALIDIQSIITGLAMDAKKRGY